MVSGLEGFHCIYTTESSSVTLHLTHVSSAVSVVLSDSSEGVAGEVGEGGVSGGVAVTLHDVQGQGACVASHLPH